MIDAMFRFRQLCHAVVLTPEAGLYDIPGRRTRSLISCSPLFFFLFDLFSSLGHSFPFSSLVSLYSDSNYPITANSLLQKKNSSPALRSFLEIRTYSVRNEIHNILQFEMGRRREGKGEGRRVCVNDCAH